MCLKILNTNGCKRVDIAMNELVENFKDVYERLDSNSISSVRNIYDKDIKFIDPFHEVNGLEALVGYFSKLYRNIESCEFDFQEVFTSESSAMITWNMKFRHKSLSRRVIEVPGSTEIRFNEKIHYHRDYFDAGKMLYENVPLIGSAIRYIKKKV